MRSFHSSYVLFSFGYVFLFILLRNYFIRLCALFIWLWTLLFGFVLFSFRYVLFPLCALCIRSFYALFLRALFMRSFCCMRIEELKVS